MAKEMMIIFVYDTQLVKKEDDDPISAILYFYPNWVSDQQKTALCGQIMGTVHCLKTLFICPKIVSLQSGKFYIKQYGRYILAVGTDRNIADWVLEHRTNTLSSLISFFHNDLEAMTQLYQTNSNFSAKLYHMFETYLKILTYGGNMFSSIPTVHLPKSANNVFLEATHILQYCQQVGYVLGGTVLYHNKVVATQLTSDLTKLLILTDPYRIKSPAEVALVDFQLPLGVQLLQVYIDNKNYHSLHKEAIRNRTVFQYFNKKSIKKVQVKSTQKEPVISTMKRDQSLLFTAVPEEDSDHHSPVNIENTFITMKMQNRPKFLNLRSKTTDVKSDDKSEIKSVPCTPFNGQTSVCSTPMTELKKVLHQSAMSICLNPVESDDVSDKNLNDSFKTDSVNSILSALSEKSNTSLHSCTDKNFEKLNKTTPYLSIDKNLYDNKKSVSMLNIKDKLKSFNKHVTIRYYSIGLPNIKNSAENNMKTSSSIENKNFNIHKTIADPTFPVFRSDGKVISRSLYQKFLTKHMNNINTELKNTLQTEINTNEWKSIEDFDSDFIKTDETNLKCNNDVVINKLPKEKSKFEKPLQKSRKVLSLPLKSLSFDSSDTNFSPVVKNRNAGVQLTPLMSKLSMLVTEERSSGFCSRDTTPSEYKDFCFTPSQANYSFLNQQNKVSIEQSSSIINEITDDSLQKCVLFICGQQDMVMGVLLEDGACSSPDTINKLWEICTEYLGRLERQLRHCLETYPTGVVQGELEPYSYLCMDTDWDTVQRGGPWSGTELGTLTHLHRDFINTNNLTEIILRMWRNPHCGLNIKTAAYIVGTISALIAIVNLIFSGVLMQTAQSRGIQINFAVQLLFLIACLPFFFGILWQRKELLVPFMISTVYSTLLCFIWICIAVYIGSVPKGYANYLFNFGPYNKNVFCVIWICLIACNIYFVFIIHNLWKEFNKIDQADLTDSDLNKFYAYRRFDEDSIIYGHHCGNTEVFYHQSISSTAGLPTPADPMGIVPLKAKRRLERDHAIILF